MKKELPKNVLIFLGIVTIIGLGVFMPKKQKTNQ